ncbi:MAG TPA: molybdopterin molybdotransferase MoeA, partial [Microthrixaceae bacterium]|nr:molybdopterin molybdotransferase MoeA [Microthrixaceae bacterium]
MVPFDEMQRRVLDGISSLPSVAVPLRSADGRVLADDVMAERGFPLFDNSAMDGFAVRQADVATTPTQLSIVGVSSAGHPAAVAVGPGEAIRILTGAMMVVGADTIVPVEDTELLEGGDSVRILATPPAGTFIRRAGAVIQPGEIVLSTGTQLNAGHLGVLAGLGVDRVVTSARPRVVVLATGDELREPGSGDLSQGQIYESNNIVLVTLLEKFGCEVRVVHCEDDVDALVGTLDELSKTSDLIISTGGVSMGGEFDALRVATGHFQ